MGCFSGCLMSSASDQKLFCGVCSAFKCSFDEFVWEKVVSPSCSSAILAPPPVKIYITCADTHTHTDTTHVSEVTHRLVGGMCNFLVSVSSQQKFEVIDQLSDGPVLQLHVTAQFYLENKGKYIVKVWGHHDPKDRKRRERGPPPPRPLAPLFMFFLRPLGCPM